MFSTTPGPRVQPQLELLSQMIEDISGELALDPLLARLVERACRLIGADDGLIGLYVPERDVIRIAATYNISDEHVQPETKRGNGLTGHVLAIDAPWRGYYHELPDAAQSAPAGLHVIGMPIRARGRLVGIFGIGAHSPRQLSLEAQEVLDLFARHAAIAIDNAIRYSQERRRSSRFAMISRVAGIIASGVQLEDMLQRAADAIHELLDYDNVDIPLIEPEAPGMLVVRVRGGDYKRRIRHVDRLPATAGIMGAAVLQRRTQRINDVSADPRYVTPPGVTPPLAELAVPILHGEEVLGVLNVEGNHAFDDLDQASLEIVAEYLAMAIINARLFEQNKQLALVEQRQRLARDLHDNVTQLLASMSLITQSLAEAWQRDPADGERRARRVAELTGLAFAELRAMLHELAPKSNERLADAGRPQRLQTKLHRLLHAMVPPYVTLSLDLESLPPQVELHEEAVLRVCQEAVSNAVRHGAPSRIEVSATTVGAEVHVRISDDGRGIQGPVEGKGMGMRNMRQRLHERGGQLKIVPREPQGTVVIARIPRIDSKQA
jgi:signal transduction histidine kinase